jgi:hypothetical protein
MPGHADHGSLGAGGDTERTGACGDDIAPRSSDLSSRCVCRAVPRPLADRRGVQTDQAPAATGAYLRLVLACGAPGFRRQVFDNLNALAAYVATNTLLDPGSTYKINRTLEIDKIKRQIGRWLLAATATTRRLKPILEEIALNLQKFVPNRSQPRKPQPKPHLSHAYK